MNLVVSILLVFNLYIAVKYLFFPGVKLFHWHWKKENPTSDVREPELSRTTALTMILCTFVYLWAMMWWAALYSYDGVENFCEKILDTPAEHDTVQGVTISNH
jgi:hypothetical protein